MSESAFKLVNKDEDKYNDLKLNIKKYIEEKKKKKKVYINETITINPDITNTNNISYLLNYLRKMNLEVEEKFIMKEFKTYIKISGDIPIIDINRFNKIKNIILKLKKNNFIKIRKS